MNNAVSTVTVRFKEKFIALLKEKAFQLPALQFCVTLLSYVTKNKIRIADLQIFKMLEKVL